MPPPTKPRLELLKQLIPPLSPKFHKGQAGRIAVVGGSEDYTGAPFYSGMSAMRLGADLCHIFCEPGAATPIKSYSPDLIVHPYMRKTEKNPDMTSSEIIERISSQFHRLHVIVVGPGLSRDDKMIECATELITKAKESRMPIVIDADGLFLVQSNPNVIKNYRNAVLTPNPNELKRLCETMGIRFDAEHKDTMAERLAQAFGGVTVLQKGPTDLISNGQKVFQVDDDGGLKRCGGQGDILTGLIATFLAWGEAYKNKLWDHPNEISSEDIPMMASYASAKLMRECSRAAFQKHERATQTSDMLSEIGSAFRRIYGSSVDNKL
ncbi:uncharacterized protein VTP21DRAFT_6566 [Calcarisporiella thermophila]|uniref:uncharacterized protein n=1 Tax=Calcarisporiella thermophila TaxID=911321 RepID=UPI00374468ED